LTPLGRVAAVLSGWRTYRRSEPGDVLSEAAQSKNFKAQI